MKLSFQNDFKHLQCHLPTKNPIKKQFITSYSWYSKLFYPGSNCSMVESIVCVFYLHYNHDSTRTVLFPWIILFTTGKKLSYRMHWTKLCMKHISFFVMTSLSNTAINLRLLMKLRNPPGLRHVRRCKKWIFFIHVNIVVISFIIYYNQL